VPALRAGDRALADALIARATPALPDDHVALQLALALRAQQDGRLQEAEACLDAAAPRLEGQGDARVSLRLRSAHALARAERHEAAGQPADALAAWHDWRRLQAHRSERAAAARHLGSILQTELLQLRHRLQENEARRLAAERSRAALAEANEQLTRKIAEVQALQAQLQAQATQDALTGLANRRHLNERLPAMLALAQREGTPLAVVLIDLDHFKRVNDGYGHPAGDQLLAAFGALLREHLRKSDQAFRYGGEEFCLLLPETDGPEAAAILDAYRRRVEEADLVYEGKSLKVTISGGVATFPADADGRKTLFEAADQALYAAKQAGRNRVTGAVRAAAAVAGT
jgi:diguanylate cyclase (GGDEF)-like protein